MKPYYYEDNITIFHGDCREIVGRRIGSQPGDPFVVLTDPPYGTGQKIAYDVYRDTMPEWLSIMDWLLKLPYPMAFTMSHTRLFDLPRRPQWTGCWDKVFTGGIVHVGASPTWEPICFYNLPNGSHSGNPLRTLLRDCREAPKSRRVTDGVHRVTARSTPRGSDSGVADWS